MRLKLSPHVDVLLPRAKAQSGHRSVRKGAVFAATPATPATPTASFRRPAQTVQPAQQLPIKAFAARTAHSQTVKTCGLLRADYLRDTQCRHLQNKVSKLFAKHHIDVIICSSITQNQELERSQTMIPTDAVLLSPCLIPEHRKHFGTVPCPHSIASQRFS